MGKPTPCPGGCGSVLDYDSVPSYSAKRERAGKYCPTCGFPLDAEAAKKDHLEYGPESADAMTARGELADGFHKASATPEKKAEPAKASA